MIKATIYSTKGKKINIFVVILFALIFVVAQLSVPLSNFTLYFLIPCLFIYSLIQSPKLILGYKPLLYFLLLIVVSAVSLVKSTNMDISVHEMRTLFGGYALCYIVTQFSLKNPRYIYLFYVLYILLFFVVIFRGFLEGITFTTSERFSTVDLNANYFGYVGFCAIISSFFIWQYFTPYEIRIRNNTNKIHYILFIISALFSITANIYAASRAGTFISAISIILLLMVKYFSRFTSKTALNVILLPLIIIPIIYFLNTLYTGSVLNQRVTTESIKDDSRLQLITDAYNTGVKNIYLGVGPGNFKYYSYNEGFAHSTFFEIFANNGIFALLLFIAILFLFLKNMWKFKPHNENQRKIRLYFILFFLLFFVYNFFYVFHTSPFLICFFYLVFIHAYIFLESAKLSALNKKMVN